MTSSARRVDAGTAAALFVIAVAYLVSLPHNLGFADESYFLYEAKRIRDGEMLYRDIFQYVTPIAPYVMAALYWVFGTTMTTARVSTAVLHGLTVVLIYASARTLGVLCPLAAIAALAHLAIAQPSWPFASWHWFSTCITAVILLVLVRGRWSASPRATLALGAWCGLLIGIQQQRGVIPTVGVGLIVLLGAFSHAWTHNTTRMITLTRAVAFAAGVALVIVPVLLVFIVGAGTEAVYHALVGFPMQNYRDSFQTTWGSINALTRVHALDTYPRLLRLLPLALLLPLLQSVLDALRRRDGALVRRRATLILFATSCCASIWYFPDFVHIGFIAGPLFVSAALSVSSVLDALPLPSSGSRAIGWIIAIACAALFAQHLGNLSQVKWAQYPFALETAFGRIDFAKKWEPVLVDAIRTQLAQNESKELFCYPTIASPYLTTGAKNPTPFQHFHAAVFPAQDTARVIAIVTERQVPYLLMSPFGVRKDDPIAQLVERDYAMVNIPELDALPSFWLFQRRPAHD